MGLVRELFAFFVFATWASFTQGPFLVSLNEGLWALGMLTLNRIYANIGYDITRA